ncbi:hypothetical protein N9X24_03415 [Rickettsiales bacterium]|nr:hypothetical protein [Rickettsiales bacterium]
MSNLENIIKNFQKLNIHPVIGLEWEFYLLDQDQPLSEEQLSIFSKNITNPIQNNQSIIIEREYGNGQIEIKTKPYHNIAKLCQDFISIKKSVRIIANKMNLEADFSAQKYPDDCGSSLQININFLNNHNNNVFVGSSDNESQLLLYAIAGILKYTPEFLDNYIADKEDLTRFDKNLNINLHRSGKYTAPTNISWGYDNRTTAIRIIGKDHNRRLEFRVPSSNSYIIRVIESLLKSVSYGINEKNIPINATYGNSFKENFITLYA